MDEYILEVKDFEGEVLELKTFADNLMQVIDNMVSLKIVETIETITRTSDDYIRKVFNTNPTLLNSTITSGHKRGYCKCYIFFAFRYFFLYHWNRTDSGWWPNGFALIFWLATLSSKPNLRTYCPIILLLNILGNKFHMTHDKFSKMHRTV